MASAEVDPRLGRVQVSYPDPRALGWGGVIGGAVTLAIGLFPVVVVATGDASAGLSMNADSICGLSMIAIWNLIGLGVLWAGISDLRRKPVWHLCDAGAVCTGARGAEAPIFWREVRRVTIVAHTRRGTVVGHSLDADGRTIPVPSETVAKRGAELWNAAAPR